MALRKCKKCDMQSNTQSSECPYCGDLYPRHLAPYLIYLLPLLLAGLIFLFSSDEKEPKELSSQSVDYSESPTPTQETKPSPESLWAEETINENESMIEYARNKQASLANRAVNVSVDPNFLSWAALWTYTMADGSTVKCTRGTIGNKFTFSCDEQ